LKYLNFQNLKKKKVFYLQKTYANTISLQASDFFGADCFGDPVEIKSYCNNTFSVTDSFTAPFSNTTCCIAFFKSPPSTTMPSLEFPPPEEKLLQSSALLFR
jgi:hypothetical protein